MTLTRRDAIAALAATSLLTIAHSAAAKANPKARSGSTPWRQPDLAPRERLKLDFGWRFHLGDANDLNKDFQFGANQRTYAKQGVAVAATAAPDFTDIGWGKTNFDDAGWEQINLPHDWAVGLPFVQNAAFHATGPKSEDPRNGHGFKPLGREYPETSIGWYRKHIELPATDAGKRLTLEFDGVYRDALLIFNGYILARNEGGYAPFSVDITDVANIGGTNLITVRVDATLGEGWFYEGAGIYRHVWLVKTSQVHVPQWGVLVRGETSGAVALATDLVNEADTSATFSVTSVVLDEAGTEVARAKSDPLTLEPWAVQTLIQNLTVVKPVLWDIGNPHQYTVMTELGGDAVMDRFVTRFGLRSIQFDPNMGFSLNGRSLKLRGVNNHQDHAGVGTAIPDRLQRFRLEIMKDMGVNAVRTAHNPATAEMLDACDEMGILVMEENRLMSSGAEAISQLERMVRRDRNRPSVIAWSIGNEEPQEGSVRGARVAHSLKRAIRRLDPTRIVGAAMDNSFVKPSGLSPELEFIGVNYNAPLYDEIHKTFPDKIIVGTEVGSSIATRGVYVRDDQKRRVSAYDTEAPPWGELAHDWLPRVETTAYLAGGFVWTGLDYRGEPTPYYTWPNISSQFGITDTCGFPKDTYYYIKSWWRPDPLVHLLPHWNWADKEGQDIKVWVYSNLDEVELRLNGRSLGKRAVAKFGYVEWMVPYSAGTLEAQGYKGEKPILIDARETTGPAFAIQIAADRSQIFADGEDVAILKISVVDAKGRVVPDAGNLITFTVTGPGQVIGVGNGNPLCHEPDKASQRSVFNGLCQVIVQSMHDESGVIHIDAAAAGLQTGRVVVTAANGE